MKDVQTNWIMFSVIRSTCDANPPAHPKQRFLLNQPLAQKLEKFITLIALIFCFVLFCFCFMMLFILFKWMLVGFDPLFLFSSAICKIKSYFWR